MKVTIRNLKTMPTHDGLALHCKVFVDGKEIGIAHDDGWGGELDFQIHPNSDATRTLIKKLEDYAASLPKINVNEKFPDMKPLLVQPTMSLLIDFAISDKLNQMEERRQKQQLQKGIVYGTSLSNAQILRWKGKTLKDMAAKPDTRFQAQLVINKIKKNLKMGEKILNEEYLRSLGFEV